jgi:predicted metal-binding protein
MSDRSSQINNDAIKKYISTARRLGAENVVAVRPRDIVFDGRTILKCMYGCNDWGKGCTCPSREGFPPLKELRKLLKKYKTVLIIHSHDKKVAQNASLTVENEAYLDGDALVFSMSDCALCDECAGRSDQPCRNVMKARPSFHSVGIDVFSTVKKLGLPLHPLRDKNEEQNWYAAVWLN